MIREYSSIHYLGNKKSVLLKGIFMHKIDKEEWAFAMDTKDPQYEEKFDTLFRKYYENTLEAGHLKDYQLSFIEEYSLKPYWVLNLPALPNQPNNAAERYRIKVFLALCNGVGIINDLDKNFGIKQRINIIKNLYATILVLQNNRYAVEVLGEDPNKNDKENEYSRIIKIGLLIMVILLVIILMPYFW